MTDPVVQQPTTAQLLAAFAQSLLPLAGPTGIAVSALIPAVEQLLANFRSNPTQNYSVDDLVAIVVQGNANLASLKAHVEGLPK